MPTVYVKSKGKRPAVSLKELTPQLPDSKRQQDTIVPMRELTDANIVLFEAFKKLSVTCHIMKVGGTANHAGSFDHCKSPLCRDNRKLLESIEKNNKNGSLEKP